MIVYAIGPDEGYEWINCVERRDYSKLIFDGRSRAASWQPVAVRRVKADQRSAGRPSDFPWLSGAVVMRRRTMETLRDLLEPSGEILPLGTTDGVELYVLNVTRIIDALDEQASEIVRFPDDGTVMRLGRTVVLREEAVRGIDVFRLRN